MDPDTTHHHIYDPVLHHFHDSNVLLTNEAVQAQIRLENDAGDPAASTITSAQVREVAPKILARLQDIKKAVELAASHDDQAHRYALKHLVTVMQQSPFARLAHLGRAVHLDGHYPPTGPASLPPAPPRPTPPRLADLLELHDTGRVHDSVLDYALSAVVLHHPDAYMFPVGPWAYENANIWMGECFD